MSRYDLLDVVGETPEEYVLEALETRQQAEAKRLSVKRMVLVALAAAMVLALVGCGVVYLLKMQDLKLGEGLVDRERWDQEKQTVITQTVPQQVLTLSGLKGSPNYQAAQEWYEFEQTYDPDHKKFYAAKDDPFDYSEKYEFYSPYTQEMVDKIDEICAKYDLKLVGQRVKAQTDDDMREYLGIDTILLPSAPAKEVDPSMSYYENGYFSYGFWIQMDKQAGAWPYESYVGYTRMPKDCFDDSFLKLEGDDWQERNYTTKSGDNVLIMRSPTVWQSWAFCDQKDATILIRIETIHEVYTDEHGYQEVIQTPMTEEQLNQVLDTINFDLKPNPGDPAVLEGQKASETLSQTSNGYTVEVKDVYTDGYRILVTLGITAPEDVDLEQYLDGGTYGDYAQLGFGSPPKLSSYSLPMPNYAGGNMGIVPDHDGKVNTVDYYMDMDGDDDDGMPYPQGGKINLLLNGMDVEAWNDELAQFETLLEIDGTWNFDIPIENGDWREIEFISEPVVTTGTNSWDINGNDIFKDITITSLKLRALGGDFFGEWENSQPDICDYRNDKYPTLTLKDGSTIRLASGLEPYREGAGYEIQRIPLDEIETLTLIDGTVLTPVSTVAPVSHPKQTQNGYTLELKSAVTDGRTARIILGVTAPEGTVLSKKDGIYDMYGAIFGNFGNYSVLQVSDGRSWRDYGGGMETMRGLEDGDGKENTVDILYITEMKLPNEGVSEIYFDPDLTWTLHIEGITMDRSEYPEKILTQTVPLFSNEDTWDLEFAFDKDTDTREIEFLTKPKAIKAKTVGSGDSLRDLTMESFRLSSLQLRVDWKDDIAGNLFDHASEPYKNVTVVMKDGTRVPLDGSGDYTISDYVNPIDLDEVDYVELIDGTKLYPQR